MKLGGRFGYNILSPLAEFRGREEASRPGRRGGGGFCSLKMEKGGGGLSQERRGRAAQRPLDGRKCAF